MDNSKKGGKMDIEISKIFQNNIGNTLTVELANGMIFAIKGLLAVAEEDAKEDTNKVKEQKP